MSYERSPRLVCSITTGIIDSSPFIQFHQSPSSLGTGFLSRSSSPSIFSKSYYIPLVNKGQIFTFFQRLSGDVIILYQRDGPLHLPNLAQYNRFRSGVHPRLLQRFRHLDESLGKLSLLLELQPSRQM